MQEREKASRGKLIEAYVDESGAVRLSRPFVAGIWFSAHPLLWRQMIAERRDEERFGWELHFHRISRKKADWRAKVVQRIFRDLRRVPRSWYFRAIYVGEEWLGKWRTFSPTDVYDTIVASLVLRFGPFAKADQVRVVLDAKNRPTSDCFLPAGLEILLNERSSQMNGPRFMVEMRSSRNDDLLQLADLITSAIAQMYHPSGNRNKKRLAGLLEPLVEDRIRIWEWTPN